MVRANLESLRHRHAALEEVFGDLSHAALASITVTGTEGHLLPDRLRALSLRVRHL